ncbi:ubiquitin carboxyl-terminal hydrolase 6 [Diutina catenulata]
MKITIKNAGKTHEIELNDNDTGAQLKAQIQQLTLIPPERQKILVKGGKVNDDTLVSSLDTSKPIMVLGTPDAHLPVAPAEKVVFLEDMKQQVAAADEPSGLVNLGNTCYLNSSLQAIYQMGDVKDAVVNYNRTANPLIKQLKSLFERMDKRHEQITPSMFLTMFRQNFPQFAERGDFGFKQQDAEEALSQILSVLRSELSLDDDFRLTFKNTTKCVSAPQEPEVESYEDSYKLNCHIDIKINFLRDGLLKGLTETLEKHSETLGTNAEYQITRTITRLPKYLTVHFVRFFWKQETRTKSKILRKVQFPFELDVSEMLDPSIKPEKIEVRDKLHKVEKENEDLVRDFKKTKRDSEMTPQQQEEEDEMKIASIKSKFHDEMQGICPVDIDTTTENPSSVYELTAVITHQGATAESGHYQAFVKDTKGLDSDRWWKFNDDKVTAVSRDKIEQLAGGGESDSALVLIYKAAGL